MARSPPERRRHTPLPLWLSFSSTQRGVHDPAAWGEALSRLPLSRPLASFDVSGQRLLFACTPRLTRCGSRNRRQHMPARGGSQRTIWTKRGLNDRMGAFLGPFSPDWTGRQLTPTRRRPDGEDRRRRGEGTDGVRGGAPDDDRAPIPVRAAASRSALQSTPWRLAIHGNASRRPPAVQGRRLSPNGSRSKPAASANPSRGIASAGDGGRSASCSGGSSRRVSTARSPSLARRDAFGQHPAAHAGGSCCPKRRSPNMRAEGIRGAASRSQVRTPRTARLATCSQ